MRLCRRSLLFAVVLIVAGCATSPRHSPGPMPDRTPPPAETAAPEPVPAAESDPVTPQPATLPAASRPLAISELAERNDERLLQVYVGMSRRSVDQLMQGVGSAPYANPFRRQTLVAQGERYEVLYFVTRAPAAGRGIRENHLTPIILRDDRVVAIGRFPLKKLRRGECPGRKSACPQ